MTRITTLILVALLLWASEVRAEEPVKIHTPTGCFQVFDRSGVYKWMEVDCVGGTASAYPFPRCLDTMEAAMRAMDEFVTLTRPHENENPWGLTGIMRCDSTIPSHCSPDQWLDEEILDIERRRLILKAQREWDQRKAQAVAQWKEAKACWRKP